MSNDTSRRNFLGISAIGIAAGVVANETAALAADPSMTHDDPSPRNGSEIAIHVTSADQRYASAPVVAWTKSSAPRSATPIQLNPGTKFQAIQGFGGAFTDATCYMFNKLPAAARAALFHEMFDPSEMNLNLCRTCIGASDYSTKLYSYDDGDADPDLTRFSIEQDRAWILPMIREARKVNPDLFLFSTPWSPPGWMKFNNSMLGGSMRWSSLKVYAQYFLKFLQAYAAEGVTIQAVSSQNELDTDQDGRMPACIWPQEYEIRFIRDHLGPLLESTNTPVKIWLLDHNYNLWGRVVDCLEDEKLRKYSNSVAWHGYYGTPDMMSKAHEYFPDAEMHWTEGGPDYTDADYLNGWCKWGRIFTDVLRNWCGSITTWNLALDEVGKPNIGPFPCGGVVSIHSGTQEITRSAQFWGLAHFSRTIRRGAHRFDSQSANADVLHVAFENPDGSKVLVLTNKGAATTIALRQGKMNAAIPLKENSVTTLTWS